MHVAAGASRRPLALHASLTAFLPPLFRSAYALWILGFLGLHRFYVGRPVSGAVWLFTGGLFGIGWIVDFFLIPEFVEEHNKRVFHQQMIETGSSLLFDGEYGHAAMAPAPYAAGGYAGYAPAGGAAYSQQPYYPQPGKGGGYGYEAQYY